MSLGRTENKSVHKAFTHIFKILRRENNMVVNNSSSQQRIVLCLSKSHLTAQTYLSVCIDTDSGRRITSNRNSYLIESVDEEADLSSKISSNNSQFGNNVIVLVKELRKTIKNHLVCKTCLSQMMEKKLLSFLIFAYCQHNKLKDTAEHIPFASESDERDWLNSGRVTNEEKIN